MSVAELVKMSNRYGTDENYVLAGGGNTSFKEDGVMLVKGSGTALGNITAEGFVKMDMPKLAQMLKKAYPEADDEREAAALSDMNAARLPGEEEKRPSVEAILHALFPYRFVLHVHPPMVNGLTCGKNGEAVCRELYGEDVVWVPLTKPGYVLATVCDRLLGEAQKKTGKFPQVILLKNHGIFVAADTVAEIDSLMEGFMARLKAQIKREPDFTPVSGAFTSDVETLNFVKDESSMQPLMNPFTPDHIVYCKHRPLYIAPGDDMEAKLAAYRAENGFAPRIVAVKNTGFFPLAPNGKAAERAMLLWRDAMKVAVYAESFGGANPLPEEFASFILNWEVERYRTAQ
jgi:rhamnose utilization protein RhaD (predicted bifunctional aldolase and dehydrogenase)